MLCSLKIYFSQQAEGGVFPTGGVSAVTTVHNTPIVEHMFKQGLIIFQPAASSGRIPGAAFHQWPVWGWGLAREPLYGDGP